MFLLKTEKKHWDRRKKKKIKMGNKVGTLLTAIKHERKLGPILITHENEQMIVPFERVHVEGETYSPPIYCRATNAIYTKDDHPVEPEARQEQLQDDVRVVQETGQAPTFFCEICVDQKPPNESFTIKGCAHFYCSDCMVQYVLSKLQDNVLCIRCPVLNCEGVLEPEYCRPILPVEVFDRWGYALCESLIIGSQKFYCPFNDCSGPLLFDVGEVIFTPSKCPYCRRLFCMECKVPWHSEIDCEKFQKLNKHKRGREDNMMKDLAKRKKWKRCPKCKFYVEKSNGCIHMRCRCGFAFCYICGAPSSSIFHKFSKCKRA